MVSIMAFANITGNPLPNVTWIGPDGLMRNNIGRFMILQMTGQLNIDSIELSDIGLYNCTLANGIGLPLTHSVNLIQAS